MKDDEKESIVSSYLASNGLIKLHLNSYNQFIENDIKNIMRANNRISVPEANWWLEYNDIYVRSPSVNDGGIVASNVTPQDCRVRELSYAGEILVDMTFMRQNEMVTKKGVLIGKMPIMLRSSACILNGKTKNQLMTMKECPLDPGGYFIINGVEKVVLMQEQLSKNKIIIEEDSSKSLVCSVTSTSAQMKSKTNIYCKDSKIFLAHKSFTTDIPISILLKAMNVESDREMLFLIGEEEWIWSFFIPTIKYAKELDVHSTLDACKWILSKYKLPRFKIARGESATKINQACQELIHEIQCLLRDILITHVPCEKFNFSDRNIFLGQMVRHLILAISGKISLDDRDFFGNKRLELAGNLIGLLFEDIFKTFNEDLWMTVSRMDAKRRCGPLDISKHIKSWMITEKLNKAISSGNWIIKRFRMMRQGVTQLVSRLSYVAAIGHMTRVTSQFEKTRKIAGPRSIHSSQWGFICTSDTPEGEGCGLIKNVAIMANITTEVDDTKLIALLKQLNLFSLQLRTHKATEYVVFVNGKPIGITLDPTTLVTSIRGLRRTRHIHEFVSVHKRDVTRTVNIVSDSGRLCRPYIIIKEGKSLLTKHIIEDLTNKVIKWNDLLDKGIVEYLDANELLDCLISLDEKSLTSESTHMEIDASTILGVVAGLIPYPHHNQSPRNTYQCAMGKQALGQVALNQTIRFDTVQYQMNYPQKPLVQTKTIRQMHFDELPAGQNAIVAVMSYTGYDIEDALIINKASLDRGFARASVFRRACATLKMHDKGIHDRLMGPAIDRDTGKPKRGDELLQADGTPFVGARVRDRQILINKEFPCVKTSAISDQNAGQSNIHAGTPDTIIEFKRSPIDYKGIEPSYVDKVMFSTSENNQAVVKILLRQTRRPEIGDKFSSRHGQKGVVGMIYSRCDMPFSTQGLVPDMIMNPHGFPSRMTVGKLIELLGGKAGSLEGKLKDASCFSGDSVEDLSKILKDHGHNYLGKEILYSGVTGQPLEAYIYFGPVYYQRLKHMVIDKVHARSRGPVTALTRQPTEGRSREGGLRVGEMERDCFIAYGASHLLLERFLTSSDAYEAFVCETCGLIATSKNWCQYCRKSTNVCSIIMPYACKLLLQELMCMRILPRLSVKDK